jgi:hypothetical protein
MSIVRQLLARLTPATQAVGEKVREISTWVQHFPAVGLVFSLTPREQLPALRDASLSFCLGTIGAWLAPTILALENARPMNIQSVFDRLILASEQGDVLILVPSLVVPLFLLIFELLDDNPKILRGHQIALFLAWLGLTAVSMGIYITKVASSVADVRFLVGSSVIAGVMCFVALYLYFLLLHLPQDVLGTLRDQQTALTQSLSRRRNG